MRHAIAAYTIKAVDEGVLLSRSYAGITDDYTATTFDHAVNFLTEQFPHTVHIVWNLRGFKACLFSLLSADKRMELDDKARVYVGDTKIFHIGRMLGLNKPAQIEGNLYEPSENNFYGVSGVSNWLPADTLIPQDAGALEELGNKLMIGFETLGYYPDKLTSPVAVLTATINPDDYPTIYSFPDAYVDAMLYADKVSRYEWVEVIEKGIFDTEYQYDLTSAYASFMRDVPDTNHGTISHSKVWKACDWGIVKAKLTTSGTILPVDKNADYFTTEEINWISKRGLGEFEIEDGWYFRFNGTKPYEKMVDSLLAARQTDDPIVNKLAKEMAAGLSGKPDQVNDDGSWGELFNPIIGLITRSRCRLAIGDFIYDNDLVDDLIAVTVDGVVATKFVDLPAKSAPGQWRIEK